MVLPPDFTNPTAPPRSALANRNRVYGIGNLGSSGSVVDASLADKRTKIMYLRLEHGQHFRTALNGCAEKCHLQKEGISFACREQTNGAHVPLASSWGGCVENTPSSNRFHAFRKVLPWIQK